MSVESIETSNELEALQIGYDVDKIALVNMSGGSLKTNTLFCY